MPFCRVIRGGLQVTDMDVDDCADVAILRTGPVGADGLVTADTIALLGPSPITVDVETMNVYPINTSRFAISTNVPGGVTLFAGKTAAMQSPTRWDAQGSLPCSGACTGTRE